MVGTPLIPSEAEVFECLRAALTTYQVQDNQEYIVRSWHKHQKPSNKVSSRFGFKGQCVELKPEVLEPHVLSEAEMNQSNLEGPFKEEGNMQEMETFCCLFTFLSEHA